MENLEKFKKEISQTGIENGVKIVLHDDETVPYAIGGCPVSGYFVDYGNPTLAVALKNKSWVMTLCHESCHMDQWIEKSPFWTNSFIDGREAVEYIDEFCNGENFSEEKLNDFIKKARGVEWDCEKRSIQKAIKYGLDINVEEEIQKANSYILFYTFVKETRKWNTVGKAPYNIKEVWSLMPKTFDMDYEVVPENIKEAYYKYCFETNEESCLS